MIRARPLLNQRTAPTEKTRPELGGEPYGGLRYISRYAGCEFSKEETAYVSYQEKTPGEVPL